MPIIPGMDAARHDPAAARERMKSLAVRVLLATLLTLVIPGTALLASAVAPDEWLAFQTGLHVVALVSALLGVGATVLAVVEALSEGRRLASHIVSDNAPRWEPGAAADPPRPRRGRAAQAD